MAVAAKRYDMLVNAYVDCSRLDLFTLRPSVSDSLWCFLLLE